MDAINTINEKEAVDAIYDHLKGRYTKTAIDEILDASHDLAEGAFVRGKGIKVANIGTLHIVDMKESAYKVPDGQGGWHEGVKEAYKTVHFSASENLVQKMNTPL